MNAFCQIQLFEEKTKALCARGMHGADVKTTIRAWVVTHTLVSGGLPLLLQRNKGCMACCRFCCGSALLAVLFNVLTAAVSYMAAWKGTSPVEGSLRQK